MHVCASVYMRMYTYQWTAALDHHYCFLCIVCVYAQHQKDQALSGRACCTTRAHVTPLFICFHWLPVAARIKFKTLMLAFRTTTGSAPFYFHSLLRIYIPSRSLRSASERRLMVPSQRGSKSLSRTFSFTVPGWWNDLPTPIRNAGSLSIFKQQLKTHLFQHYLTSS